MAPFNEQDVVFGGNTCMCLNRSMIFPQYVGGGRKAIKSIRDDRHEK